MTNSAEIVEDGSFQTGRLSLEQPEFEIRLPPEIAPGLRTDAIKNSGSRMLGAEPDEPVHSADVANATDSDDRKDSELDSASDADVIVASAVPGTPPVHRVLVLSFLWSVGVTVLTVRTVIGLLLLLRIRRASTSAPDALLDLTTRIAKELGIAKVPQVKVTRQISTPCLAGLRRPCILLPESVVLTDDRTNTVSILAHECAHLKRHDLHWNVLWQAVAIVMWFHPLVWRARVAHVDACDAVVDAIAADYVRDRENYCRTLAVLALQVNGSVPATGLGMARKSVVRRRIELIKKGVNRLAIPVRAARLTGALAIVMVLGIGGLQLSRIVADTTSPETLSGASTQDQEETPADAGSTAARDTLPFLFTDESGEPLEDVAVEIHCFIESGNTSANLETDEDGRAEFKWNGDPRIRTLWFTARKPGYVAEHFSWSSSQSSIRLPELAEFVLDTGQQVSGVVNDEDGDPIAGARVEINLDSEYARHTVYGAAELSTDAAGRWVWDSAPAALDRSSVTISHREYIKGYATPVAGNETVTVLKQGITISGRVVDEDGNPVQGAVARLGFQNYGSRDKHGVTDADGRYQIFNAEPGPTAIVVQHESYGPEFEKFTVREEGNEYDFVLKPGFEIRIRVIDANGDPIEGAFVAPEEWEGLRSIRARRDSDADGNYEWLSAPAEPVEYSVGKRGYVSARDVVVEASDEVHVVTLLPELVVSGNVFDADSGQPVKTFTVRGGSRYPGRDEITWGYEAPVEFSDGQYRFVFDEPASAHFVQVSAEGYEPLTSRPFNTDDGRVQFNFRLNAGAGISGKVVNAAGEPVSGADVAYADPDSQIMVSNGYFTDQTYATRRKTGEGGRFHFPPQENEQRFLIVVLHDEGYAVHLADDPAPVELQLTPWGRVEGVVRIGGELDSGQSVSFSSSTVSELARPFRVWWDYETVADAEGRFAFERVTPGPGNAARVVITKFGSSQMHAPCWQTPVEVVSGETTAVEVGGSGIAVSGRATLSETPEFEVDWTLNEPPAITRLDPETGNADHSSYFRASANLDSSGRFTIPDIPAGSYEIKLVLNLPPSPNTCGAGENIGRVRRTFVIEEDRAEDFEIGELQVVLDDMLEPGETAPDFLGENLTGSEPIRLSDFHGKLVLVDFWATWCGPCVAALRELDGVHKQFEDDPRFAMIGVALDNSIEAPRDFLADKGYDWHQAAINGGYQSRTGRDYTIKMLPTSFLIGPDGIIIGKNLKGDELIAAIETALDDEESFENISEQPARFPVTRYDVEPVEQAMIDPRNVPSAFVITGDRWGVDNVVNCRLQMLTQSGREYWSIPIGYMSGVSDAGALAVDRQRERFYLREMGNFGTIKNTTSAFDFSGRRLWSVEYYGTLAVDPVTGNLWISGGETLNAGETVIFDSDGNEVAAWPVRGVAMSYDRFSDSMWLVGYDIIKITRDGEIKYREKIEGWCCSGVVVDSNDGTVWVSERDHSDVARSASQLRMLQNSGRLIETIALESDPANVLLDPENDRLWIPGWGGLVSYNTSDSTFEAKVTGDAVRVGVNEHGIWLVDQNGYSAIDRDGSLLFEFEHGQSSEAVSLGIAIENLQRQIKANELLLGADHPRMKADTTRLQILEVRLNEIEAGKVVEVEEFAVFAIE